MTTGVESGMINPLSIGPSNLFVEFEKEAIEQSIPDRFEAQVAKYPDRVAVKTRSHTFTYDALNKMANRIAQAVLEHQGDGNEPVAMLIESDAQTIAVTIGGLKAGKICVPINPSHPRARITYILKHSEARLILTNNKNLFLARELADNGCQVLNIDNLDPSVPDRNLGRSYSGDTLAFILYTSGSTGEPKGVIQNHRNLLHNVMRWTKNFHIGPDDRLSFVGSARRDVFRALLNGAAVYSLNLKEEGLAGMGGWLMENGITILHSVPTPFRHFVDTLTGMDDFPTLRLIVLLGEPLYPRDVESYRKHFSPSCTLVNALGCTETRNYTYYCVDKDTQITESIVPVGRVVEDYEVLLFNEAGEQIEFNQVGEIAVKSRYLSPGYWKKPDLTRAAFRTDPKGGSERLYFTGDLGLMRPDGCLIYVGRKDFQVKIRGHRVEIAEVESALLDYEGIKEVAVAASQKGASDKKLVAYFVPSKRPAPIVGELRSFLKEKLPDYMIPSFFVILDEIPLTATGKVNRRALPDPGNLRPELDVAYVAPRTPMEEEVAKVWAKVLSLDRIGIHDNFFELGGDSLLVTKLIAQIQQDLRVDLPVRLLFESPTIAQLAARISAIQDARLLEEKGNASLVSLGPGQSQTPVFCFPYIGGFRGDLLTFARLGPLIGPDYSFYGLQARGMDGLAQPHRCVADMASDYIEAMQKVQPHGPYLLVGECFSAAVAYETAQQLRSRGEEVALLALLDAKCSRQSLVQYLWRRLSARLRYRIDAISESWTRIAFHLREIQRLERGKRLRYFVDRIGKGLTVIFLVLRGETPLHPRWVSMNGGDFDRQKSKHVRRAQKGYWLAIMRYRRRPYDGKITLLVNEEWSASEPNLRWADLAAGGVEVHKIPGTHFTYMKENIQVVAKELRECLDSASYGSENRRVVSRYRERIREAVFN
jgi:amino acid adenylation domain-containing protein